jgi:hypothetical protein
MDMKAISHCWPREYLFLLTHGDWCVPTLAALLNRQLGIRGVGCSGLAYEHSADLLKLRWCIAKSDRSWPCGRFLFDALVSNDQYLPAELVASPKLRALISVQRPVASLLSMVKGGVAKSYAEAEHLYRDRLQWLSAAGPDLGERALVFPGEMLAEGTNTLLAAIALHIGMERAFEPVPQSLLDCEGADRPAAPRQPELAVGLAARLRQRCEDAYHETLLELSRSCLSIGIISGITDPESGLAPISRPRPSPVTQRRCVLPAIIRQSLPEGTLQ